MLRYQNFVMNQPEVLYLLIPLILLLIILIRRKYVKDNQRLFKNIGIKRFVFTFRLLFLICIVISLSQPYLEYNDDSANLTQIKILVDKSYSMDLYETQMLSDTLKNINTPIDIKELNLEDYSSLGSSILSNIKPNENILIVSDGQNNFGPKLSDVMLFASSINSKIYGLNLNEKEKDASITILGPSKVISDVENEFSIIVNEIGDIGNKNIQVFIDDELILETLYTKELTFKRSFSEGNHIIQAVLDRTDYFTQNNIFYKGVAVYPKPKVLFVTKKNSPLLNLYSTFYDITKSSSITNINNYHAIILNDISADEISDENINDLQNYLNNENGLMVIGGKNSYDYGGYNNSLFTSLLPVSIGQAKKKKDVINLFIIMDTGVSSFEEISSEITLFDVQKSVLADVIRTMNNNNKVGILEGNFYLNTLTPLSIIGPKKTQVIGDISLLTPHGVSELHFAYANAHKSIRLAKGSKNIMIITDGLLGQYDQTMTLESVIKARQDAIKTYIIGVGEHANEEFLMSIKEHGDGEYFRIDETQKINLYFGDPSESSADDLEVYVYDSNHFITKDLDDLSLIYGFNSVYPKENARQLLTTSKGDPVLTVWNMGLGRVAALSTDDGSLWIPDMLKDKNSKSFIKTLNWLIENPDRKNNLVVEFPDIRIGENVEISVHSDRFPKAEGLSFYESEKGIYKTNIFPNQTGIIEILGYKAGINYKKEYLNLGINNNFEKNLKITGGRLINLDATTIEQELKSISRVESLKTIDLTWIFLLIAIIIYLFEILIRKIQNIKISQRY